MAYLILGLRSLLKKKCGGAALEEFQVFGLW